MLGSTFEELAEIIEHVENKDRVGVCIDTCTFRAIAIAIAIAPRPMQRD